jgi:fatty acid desaturase
MPSADRSDIYEVPASVAAGLSREAARRELEQYVDAICSHLPGWACHTLVWLREPSRWAARIIAAFLLILGGLLAFLPVLGLWMLPLGLIVIAQDLPFLQQPLLRAFRWADRRSKAWRQLHATSRTGHPG